ncbi:MAG TPA: ATP-binding protein [Patescibacteria group bacterium]|nr:ATP-binding protein [Patescibacteria group bacterium]
MLSRESLYSFLESNFDYLLVLDGDEHAIIHVSRLFGRDCCPHGRSIEGKQIKEVLSPASLNTFRASMAQARAGGRGIAVYSPLTDTDCSIPLKAGYAATGSGSVYIFFGNKLGGLTRKNGWEKEERIKELSCLYKVAELIEVSRSIDEFFNKLPKSINTGMLYPEEAVVYSVYDGVEYGQKPVSDNYISVRLVVGKENKGEIRLGYLDDRHELLPDEQRMLDEIGRMLNLALERKVLRERLIMKQEEEAEFTHRLQELSKEIAAKTRELEEEKRKLDIVNSYLDRTKGGWDEAKARLETMFNAIPDEVVLLDTGRKIIMTNRKDIEPGQFCFRAMFGRDRPCEDCRLARIMQDKTPVTLMMKQDERYLQVHALPVYNQDHEVDGILEFYRDVTLEKTYDQQLQQADKLASLGELVSGIGHEINNPNQFIRGNIKIIQQALEDVLPIVDEYYREHPDLKIARLNYDFFRQHIMTLVDDMAHGSERIKGIVEGLRTFVRKDEGLLVDTIDINTLIEASTRLVHNQVHKRADIELDLADDLPSFTGNAQKMEQVLVNLLVNAGDAMLDEVKGSITVRTRAEDSNIVVEVEDNGSGMNEKTLKQIFDPFFTTKRARGGTGLGLAIAFRIVEEHRGTISVRSKPGVGTKFIIKIPVRPKKAAKETQ